MIYIFETEEQVAEEIKREMEQQMVELEHPVFCLAAGQTPGKAYDKFAKECGEKKEVEKLRFVSLDEWVNIPKASEGSCYQMMNQDLFKKLPLKEGQVTFFDTVDVDLEKECERIDSFVKENPITFSLMGVGMNGHIGLNEPGCEVKAFTSVVPLSDTTKRVGQKYFNEQTVLENGITLGLQQIIDSKRVIVVITGAHKKEIVQTIVEHPEADLPAQKFMGHEHVDFYFDKEAAALLDMNNDKIAMWK